MEVRNLFAGLPVNQGSEVFEALLENEGMTLERIVSYGQATNLGEWLEQDRHEWVVLLSGRAALRFEDEAEDRELRPGDHVVIPARCRHRVQWTDSSQPTIWIALHYR